MARPGNRNRFGAQPSAATAPTTMGAARQKRGPGNNRGGRRGVPEGGTFGGRAGEALTNTQPESYIIGMLQKAGLYQNPASPQATFMHDKAIQNLMDQYAGASFTDQNLSVEDYFKNAYGAGPMGKKGKQFNPGSLASMNGQLQGQWEEQEAEDDPVLAATRRLANQGGFAQGGGGNTGFQDWFQQDFAPRMMSDIGIRRQASPQMGINEFMNTQDVFKQAQRAYLNRGAAMRPLSPVDPTGRYSWWA